MLRHAIRMEGAVNGSRRVMPATIVGLGGGLVGLVGTVLPWASATYDFGPVAPVSSGLVTVDPATPDSVTTNLAGMVLGGPAVIMLAATLALITVLFATGMEPRRAGALMAVISVALGVVAVWAIFGFPHDLGLGTVDDSTRWTIGLGAWLVTAACGLGLAAAVLAVVSGREPPIQTAEVLPLLDPEGD